MKLIGVLAFVVLIWDLTTAPPGRSAVERAYHALATSALFHSPADERER